MDSRTIKNGILLIVFVFYTFIFRFLIFPNFMKYSEIFNATFFVLFLFVTYKFLGFRKEKTTILTRNILKVFIFHLLLIFIGMYISGFFVGFLTSAYSRALFTMFENVIGPLLIIILVELLRYMIIWANKNKKYYIFLFTIAIIIFECFSGIRTINFNEWESVFRISATVILPVIVKNIMLSYICFYVGYKIPILYRIVMELYIFIVPVVPDLGEYINSMISISVPLMIYINSFGMVDYYDGKDKPVLNSNNFDFVDIPIVFVFVIVVCLISGLFPLSLIGIGSDSMNPSINKGDAVIVKRVKKYEDIKKNDVVVYKKGKLIIIHRIVDIDKINGKTYFTTKGDANGGPDPNKVKTNQIKGVVKFKIPYLGYPSVMLNDYLNSR